MTCARTARFAARVTRAAHLWVRGGVPGQYVNKEPPPWGRLLRWMHRSKPDARTRDQSTFRRGHGWSGASGSIPEDAGGDDAQATELYLWAAQPSSGCCQGRPASTVGCEMNRRSQLLMLLTDLHNTRNVVEFRFNV